MRAYDHFLQELNNLTAFLRATIYSYEQTENLVQHCRKNNIPFDIPNEIGLTVKHPHLYKTRLSAQKSIRNSLSAIIFVKVVSALEVFLIDQIRDVFLETKEPFKKKNKSYQFTHEEILSISSPAEVFTKIINKECRDLSSGGLDKIIKYYAHHLNIQLGQFSPGKMQMEEYHDRRHLLVHRLGRTDLQYRKKYNFTKNSITIDIDYLLACINDFKIFADLTHNQVLYRLKTDFITQKKQLKQVERKVVVEVDLFGKNEYDFLESNFNFWVGDNYIMLSDILDSRLVTEPGKMQLSFSGKIPEVRCYVNILRTYP